MLQEQKAIVGRDVGELQELLDAGAGERDWSWRGNERRTALELAAVIGQQEMVKLLTEAGANTNHLSASGNLSHGIYLYTAELLGHHRI